MKRAVRRMMSLLLMLCLLMLISCVCFAKAEPPATLYHNPKGGGCHHADAECPSVKENDLPMEPFNSALLPEEPYGRLKPCPVCLPGGKAETPAYQPRTESVDNAGTAHWAAAKLYTVAAARAFAEAFFTSPYVMESLDGRELTITQTEDGWLAEAAGKDTDRLTLLFDCQGQVALYQNANDPLPLLQNGAVSVQDADELVYTWEALSLVDSITRRFLNKSYNAICCYAADKDTYAYHLDMFDCFVYFRYQPSLQLIGLGDLSKNDCRYEDYLSRGEAVALARDALITVCGLAREQADALIVSQTSFNPNAYQPLSTDMPLTYWYIGFAVTPNAKNGAYQVELDAKTGEILVVRDPETSGKG